MDVTLFLTNNINEEVFVQFLLNNDCISIPICSKCHNVMTKRKIQQKYIYAIGKQKILDAKRHSLY